MKIQYASDLHLEFVANANFLKHNPLLAVGNILALAGDIGYLNDDLYTRHPFWDWASDNFSQVVVAVGNHELYKYFDLATMPSGLVYTIRPNVNCYYNAVVPLNGVDLIVSTLWGSISPVDAIATVQSVSDFHRILYRDTLLTVEQFNSEHQRCRKFITEAVAASHAPHIVVMTHHLPSFRLMSPDFKGSRINGAFTVEMGDYIASSRIDYWIYGHSHRNIDAKIGNTYCVSNQLGYVSHGEHLSFKNDKMFKL